MNRLPLFGTFLLLWISACSLCASQTVAEQESSSAWLDLDLRYQTPTSEGSPRFHRLSRRERWSAAQSAVIVCDMWDSHHCVNAVRRVAELTPRIQAFCSALREQGVTIIHAPSSCMSFYEGHPARQRVLSTPPAKAFPEDMANWCDQILSESSAAYPLDQSQGGEDDDLEEHRQWAERLVAMGRNPKAPWKRQVAGIAIDPDRDFISDSGTEIWSVLQSQGIENVILVGVHTNMCVLGRPFGLRRLAEAGKNVVLARDLTDTMYDPRAWPYASHFTGTDLIVSHVERYVCPTISSNQVLGGAEHRFRGDSRKNLLMIIAEDEYQTARTLPAFAAKHLSQHFRVTVAFGDEQDRHSILGLEVIDQADAILISVRRRALPEDDLNKIREFVASGRPVLGIRTASHAFSLRGQQPPAGTTVWEDFDAVVFGGHYTNHHGNSLESKLSLAEGGEQHPILRATDASSIRPGGSLYRTSPVADGARVLLTGAVDGHPPEPVAWTYVRTDGGRSFYTSLGHPHDFAQPEFEALLSAAIHWAVDLPTHSLEDTRQQNTRYAAGVGKQR
ncbi:MAG: isochorismatase family protein [bacterium]|nr:isochorismatase family protein [bacterium]